MNSPRTILKQYWGYDSFRPLQEEIIQAVLQQKDVLALLPTGGGKSLCYQIPALCFEQGICLVVSPLIALMKDQVEQLTRRNIPALSIISGLSYTEAKKTLENALHGDYKFLYVSPERLGTKLFQEYISDLPINLVAVDEAHCISQWGYDFRPPYLRIATIREQLSNHIPVIALTASATLDVQNDICEKLLFKKNQQRFQQSFERPNLSYNVLPEFDKKNKLFDTLKKITGSGIVYCKSRRQTKEIADLLNMHRISADFYHAGLPQQERDQKQTDWIGNKFKVMAATNAFGMGIDKPDVRNVLHLSIPDCLENYYQEAGRAGRDGQKASTLILYNTQDEQDLLKSITLKFPDKDIIKRVYNAMMNFLQIPGGYGAGNSYDFDLKTYCERFKIDSLTANYVIKLLEQENILYFNESLFHASTIVFTCDKATLNDFEGSHPELDVVVKNLLRLYEGIFDMPVSVHEKRIASFCGISVDKAIYQLKQIAGLGILQYKPQKETPQITLLQNRMYDDSFVIDLTQFHERKKQYEIRLHNMISFLHTNECRSQFIGKYFGDHQISSCGICDNCVAKNQKNVSNNHKKILVEIILSEIKKNAPSLPELILKLNDYPKSEFMKCIEYLMAENKILVKDDGRLNIVY